VIDRTGKVVARFEPRVAPNSPEVETTIEDVLAGKFKPPTSMADEDKKKDAGRGDGPDR
jgi:hypothetical protein